MILVSCYSFRATILYYILCHKFPLYYNIFVVSSLSLVGYTEIGSFPYPIELNHNLVKQNTKLIQFVKPIRCETNGQNTESKKNYTAKEHPNELRKDDINVRNNSSNNNDSNSNDNHVNNSNDNSNNSKTNSNDNHIYNNDNNSNINSNANSNNDRNNNNTHLPPHWRSVQPKLPNTAEYFNARDNDADGNADDDRFAVRNCGANGHAVDIKMSKKIDYKTESIISNIDKNNNNNNNNLSVSEKQKNHINSNISKHTSTLSLSDTIEESFDLLCVD